MMAKPMRALELRYSMIQFLIIIITIIITTVEPTVIDHPKCDDLVVAYENQTTVVSYEKSSWHIYLVEKNLRYVWFHVVTESSSHTLSGAVHTTSKEITPCVKLSPTRSWKQWKVIKPPAQKWSQSLAVGGPLREVPTQAVRLWMERFGVLFPYWNAHITRISEKVASGKELSSFRFSGNLYFRLQFDNPATLWLLWHSVIAGQLMPPSFRSSKIALPGFWLILTTTLKSSRFFSS